ncbi:MAG: hypothetical protein JW928_07040, partial [Candidatus Aureabacteria bacterium]|nr:hypothetical protein [Candidatus Auribacterota bacterium]
SLMSFSESIKDDYFLSSAEKMKHHFKDIAFPESAMKELKTLDMEVWDTRPETVIYWVEAKQPEIDGSIEDWPQGTFVSFGRRNLVLETDVWGGDSDLSGRAGMLLSPEYIYIAFDVVDDKPFINEKSGKDIWNGDGIEVAFNFNASADRNRTAMTEDDFQACFAFEKDTVKTWSWQISGEIEKADVSLKPTQKGYIVEARIPFDTFPALKHPEPGTQVTVNFVINDADAGIREHQMLWAGDQMFYADPSVWGSATIEILP